MSSNNPKRIDRWAALGLAKIYILNQKRFVLWDDAWKPNGYDGAGINFVVKDKKLDCVSFVEVTTNPNRVYHDRRRRNEVLKLSTNWILSNKYHGEVRCASILVYGTWDAVAFQYDESVSLFPLNWKFN